jgi:hypothetical protein
MSSPSLGKEQAWDEWQQLPAAAKTAESELRTIAAMRIQRAATSDHCAEPLAATYGSKLESFNKPMAMSHQVRPYTELRKQIHDDLQIQHPEWIQLNGESPMCDSYEACLVELFDAFKRREREGTKRVKESLNPERWLCRHASFKAFANFVTIRMPLNRMNPSIQST